MDNFARTICAILVNIPEPFPENSMARSFLLPKLKDIFWDISNRKSPKRYQKSNPIFAQPQANAPKKRFIASPTDHYYKSTREAQLYRIFYTSATIIKKKLVKLQALISTPAYPCNCDHTNVAKLCVADSEVTPANY